MLLRDLLLAKEKNFRKLVVNVDSSIVVGMLRGSMLCNARHEAIV